MAVMDPLALEVGEFMSTIQFKALEDDTAVEEGYGDPITIATSATEGATSPATLTS